VLRQRGRLDTDAVAQFAHRLLTVDEEFQDTNTDRVAQGLEELRLGDVQRPLVARLIHASMLLVDLGIYESLNPMAFDHFDDSRLRRWV
jgi:hypothetical protein